MNDRREPTISGTRFEQDDARRSGGQGSRSSRSASNHAPQRPIIVRSKLAPLAFLLAIASAGAAGYLAWEGLKLQRELVLAGDRIKILEEKLVMTDDESSASAAAMQASLKEAHSEIRKLWGVSYDTNRKDIADNKTQITSAVKSASKLKSEIARVESLVNAQKTSMNAVEQSAATISAQARALNEKNARAEQSLAELKDQVSGIEQDIEAINGFRRSVNQQLLQLKGGSTQ